MEKSARQRAIVRRRIFITCCISAFAVVIAFGVFIISALVGNKDTESSPSNISESLSSRQDTSSEEENTSEVTSSGPEYVTRGEYTLDANYSNLLLVNGANPLPEDYNYGENLVTVEDKYINGSLKQVNQDIWPYMRAMIEAAWKDNVKLYIWSPYRSYDTQKMLFENKIQRVMKSDGLERAAAEAKAATVVARPGTSEHHTGLAADFNMANSGFENTEMFAWMQKNAADYGFIMRYSEEKQPLTGVIHESWHWRFVGINTAKEINSLGMCLEEYLEYKGVEINKISKTGN